MKNFKKGFTLIELLVVVAIIGILASVVLASLNSARQKGSDAAIKANLSNMRAQAAMYYDTNSRYNVATAATTAISCSVAADTAGTATGCTAASLFADTTILAAMRASATASGAAVIGNTDANGTIWAVSATLKATADGNFCVDSAGSAKKNSTATTGACS